MFERIWKRILRRSRGSLLCLSFLILWPVSLVYRIVVKIDRLRQRRNQIRVNYPIISVGNIAVGGSGKTPLVGLLADFLSKEGLKVGIVSSGYARGSTQRVIARGYRIQKMAADRVGDETRLLADFLPDILFSIGSFRWCA